ncbi:MAG: glycoside hydrolase 43 family protein [Bacteroidales bacterium]|nr:glycoside hydrolase 43 family protein [Bacteroidales bacterium]
MGIKKYFLLVSVLSTALSAGAYVSEVWNPDLGNGKYKNPVINADYSDPDVVRVGDDFYMVASSFTCIPALPILHSNDMVNWTIIGAAANELSDKAFDVPSHGNGVWAPSIRFHNGEYYVCYGDPDRGIYMIKTRDPQGQWDEPMLIYEAVGVIDPCPYWDEDGKAYIAHGYAGSRAGVKSIIGMIEMVPDGTGVIGQDKVIYDGHLENPTIEGAKMYKRGDWYYIFSPAGGVATGWQEVLRSKNPWGPYEVRNVMEQGDTDINGPHQGAWVDTPDSGEDWFFHFQDKGPYGRVVHLQPMVWDEDGWPVIGVDKDGDGRGEPVTTYKKPNVGKTYPNANPVESDEFDTVDLGLQWQWNANPQALWAYCDAANSQLRLFSHFTEGAKSLYDCGNVLLQKFPAENFTVTAKVQLVPNTKNGKNMVGERGGIVVMGYDFADLCLESREDGIYLVQGDCVKANKGAEETKVADVKISDNGESPWVWLRVKISRTGVKQPKSKPEYECQADFSYSLDGKKYQALGRSFKVIEGHWIGAKVGLFCIRPWKTNDSGWLNVDFFRVTK